MSRKRYGSASAWIFFTETIFLTNFKWLSDTRRVEHFCSTLLPLPSWKAQVGLVAICTPCLLNTPPALLFCWFFFRNVMKLYEFRNDTRFLSVMSRNLTDYVIIPFLASGMLWNFTNCATMLPFYFRHVTEPHRLRNNASFWLPTCYGTSRIA